MGLGLVLPSSLLIIWATAELPAPRVGILLMTEVVAGTLSAAVLSGEPFGPPQAIGSLLIVGAGICDVLGRSQTIEPTGDPA
jgi:drug/metabolite transporter (DMT)-like permease